MPNISYSPLVLGGATGTALGGVWVHLGLSSLACDCASLLTSSDMAEGSKTEGQKNFRQHHNLPQSLNQHIRDHRVDLH